MTVTDIFSANYLLMNNTLTTTGFEHLTFFISFVNLHNCYLFHTYLSLLTIAHLSEFHFHLCLGVSQTLKILVCKYSTKNTHKVNFSATLNLSVSSPVNNNRVASITSVNSLSTRRTTTYLVSLFN